MRTREANKRDIFTQLGARNYALTEREINDYYATEPKALELLLDIETFDKNVWECACGEGHLSKVFAERGYNVRSTDLIDRGYGRGGYDFLTSSETWDGDIITNPPYSYGKEFVRKAIETVTDGHKVAMFLKIQFLESKGRRALFDEYPPKTIWVSTSRLHCMLNGDANGLLNNAFTYAWFIWQKGYKGETILKWFN